MGELSSLGKVIMVIGLIAFLLGAILFFGGKIPFMGRLPGDFYLKRDNFTFYFPLATGILISIILTVILNIIFRRW